MLGVSLFQDTPIRVLCGELSGGGEISGQDPTHEHGCCSARLECYRHLNVPATLYVYTYILPEFKLTMGYARGPL